jgi:hypothetical protein
VSFESKNFPGYFLAYRNDALLYLDEHPALQGTFCPVAGLSGAAGSVSYSPLAYPSYYIRHQGGRVKISPFEDNALYKADATWNLQVVE